MSAPAITTRPYIGLRFFEERDAHLFYGRDEHVAELLAKVAQNRFVAVMGSSGCGKSSLVRAGLLPELRAGMIPNAGPRWKVVEFRPGRAPLQELAQAIRSELGVERAQELVEEGPLGIARAVAEAKLDEGTNVLVIADQFEEVFRFQREEASQDRGVQAAEECQALARRLLDSASQPELPIYVLLVMRSDYLGECAQFPDLPERMSESLYLVPRLRRDQMQEAITAPVGGAIEPAVVQRLLGEVGSDPDQLPRLQHLLDRMWDRARGGRLTMQHYTDAGGWEKGLEQHLEDVYSGLGVRQQGVCARMFQQLSELDKGRAVRRRAEIGELTEVCGPDAADVIRRFRDAGFTTAHENPVDITHECILREWPRIREWLDRENRNARRLRELAEAANDAGWRPGMTPEQEESIRELAGLTLQNLLNWRDDAQPTLAWARRYLSAADFETAYGYLLWSEARAREQRTRELRRKRNFRIVLGLVCVGLAVASVVFYHLSRKAQESAAEAAQQGNKAQSNEHKAYRSSYEAYKSSIAADKNAQEAAREQKIAEENAAIAEREKAKAILQARITNAHRLATASKYRLGDTAQARSVSGALALESLQNYPTTDGVISLYMAVQSMPVAPKIIPAAHHGPVGSLAFSRDGGRMASGGHQDGNVIVWDLGTSEMKHRVLEPSLGTRIDTLSFSADGRWLAAGSDTGVCIWDTVTGKPVQDVIRNDAGVRSVAFSPDGQYLATANGSGSQVGTRVYSRASQRWEEVKQFPSGEWFFVSATFGKNNTLTVADKSGVWMTQLGSSSPTTVKKFADGESCFAVSASADTSVIAALCQKGIATAKLNGGLYEFERTQVEVKTNKPLDEVRISARPDGKSIAVGNSIYYLVDSDRSLLLFPPDSPYRSVFAFQSDGRMIAGGLENGAIAFWPTQVGNESILVPGLTGVVRGVTITPDEKLLATIAQDEILRLFDISDPDRTRPLHETRLGPDLKSVVFSPDGRSLVVISEDRIRLLQTGSLTVMVDRATEGNAVPDFTRDSRALFIRDSGGVRRFETDTGRQAGPTISGRFNAYSLSPDGKLLATSSQERGHQRRHAKEYYIETREVWSLSNGGEVAWKETGRKEGQDDPSERPLEGGPQGLIQESMKWPSLRVEEDASKSPDGAWRFDRAGDTVKLQDAVDKHDVASLEHGGNVIVAMFSPKSRWLVTSSEDGTVRLWPLQVNDIVAQACKLLPRNPTPEEWVEFKMDGPYRKICPKLP